jgi:lysyl-tRNA synthetase class 2
VKKAGLHVDLKNAYGYGEVVEAIYKDLCRATLIQPTFLTDYPAEMIPLAKRRKDDPTKIATFQLVAKGIELCKAYNELNDSVDQRERFKEQEKLRARGAEEAQATDEDFLQAVEYGMPPTAGFGMGIDRLTVFLTGVHSIKETILFPTLRPESAPIKTKAAVSEKPKVKKKK